MCHSCGSRNPGCFVPAPVGLMGNQDLWDTFWIPACAGMTLLSRLRFAPPASPAREKARVADGRSALSRRPPHPAWPSGRPASPAKGEANYFIRLRCYGIKKAADSAKEPAAVSPLLGYMVTANGWAYAKTGTKPLYQQGVLYPDGYQGVSPPYVPENRPTGPLGPDAGVWRGLWLRFVGPVPG